MNWRPIRGWTKLLHERGMKADSMPERLLIGPGSPPSLDPVYPELSPPLEPCPSWFGRGSPDPVVRPTGGLQVTRQRSGTGRPAVAEDGRVSRRRCPNQRYKSERKENMRRPQLCSMPGRGPPSRIPARLGSFHLRFSANVFLKSRDDRRIYKPGSLPLPR